MTQTNNFVCTRCQRSYPLDSREWVCECGGLFEFDRRSPFDPASFDRHMPGLWRYRAMLPLDPAWKPVTLGEGGTPLVEILWDQHLIHLKMECMAPTGSFKDRGAALLVTALQGLGVRRVVEDSSGNAGASLSAYAARAGIECEVCVPVSASGPKRAQMAAYGSEVIEIKGKREYAALAAWAAAAHGAYYASHVYSPYFLAGTETLAYELWEQLDGSAPAALVLPTGNGTLFMGIYQGFQRLHRAGFIDSLPPMFAVQAAACAPIYHAYVEGNTETKAIKPGPTVASGIAIGNPARGSQILAAVRATGGAVVTVAEEEIETVYTRLARLGFFVEKTSAAPIAALKVLADTLPSRGPVVVPLTGHGLKTCPQA